MNPRYIVACLAVWAFFFFYDFIFHGVILAPFYQETAEAWRPKNEMEANCIWITVSQGIFAFLFGLVFTKGYENRGIAEGARYGWLVGLLFAAADIVCYAVLPIPATLAASWAIGELVRCTLAGMLLAAIYKPLRA